MIGFEQNRLATCRLELVAATPEHILAELQGAESLGFMLGVAVEPEWPPGEYDRGAQEFFLARLEEGGANSAGWYSWYALAQENPSGRRIAIGAGGYCGPPTVAGEVEIGFSVMPAHQGRNFATEMAAALILNAFADPRVLTVVGHTTRENVASRRVLEKCFFECRGTEQESGHERYVLTRDSERCSALKHLAGIGGCSELILK